MVDTVGTKERSRIMALVPSKNSSPELLVRRRLHEDGFRFRLHSPNLPGHPDIVLARYNRVIFVHGCFWHWHGCKRSRMPDSNRDYWTQKIERTQRRDLAVVEQIASMGWDCSVIWECQLNKGVDDLLVELTTLRSQLAGTT